MPEIARSASASGSGPVIGPAPDLLDRRLLFFTGKGGVGKSTIAAATALLASNIGKRVLLIEVDAKGDIPAQFEQRPVGFSRARCIPGVLAMAMDTEASLQEYLKLNLRVPVLGRLGPLAKALDFVATAAPGVKEILTDRQDLLGGARVDRGPRRLRPRRRRRGRDRPHRRAARRGRRDPRARRRRPGARRRRSG